MQQDRYCRNCGQELQPEDRFCANCGRSVHAAAHVPTAEADVPVPPPIPPAQASAPQPQEQQPGEERDATWWAMQVMVGVFLVLVVGQIAQEMPSSPAGNGLSYQIGYSMPPAIVSAIAVAAILLLLGGVYYATGRKQGVTFREAVFNWPLVIVAAILTFVSLL